jgi:hypothetical protein
MGFNHKICGYADVHTFVASQRTAKGQLEAFLAFCQGNNLVKHLRAKNWARFAAGYNGSGYKVNAYDTKMASAYEKFA